MGKSKKIKKPKTKISWKQFVNFWAHRGLGPEEASNVLAEHWLEKGWNDGVNFNMFKTGDNEEIGIGYLDYVHEYMKQEGLMFKAACTKLATINDQRTVDTVTFLLIPNAVEKNKLIVSPTTFTKWCGWWRTYLFSDEYIETLKKIERDMLKTGTAIKVKKKKAKIKQH
tara:strand:- start:4977 stop:5483 length:507 start_codon:yes stop_codon:yes gene_type:complete